jgi:WD40 repeat protein
MVKFYRAVIVGWMVASVLQAHLHAEETRQLVGHADAVYALAFHPAGDLLASGSYDQTVKLWKWPSGEQVATLTGHTDQVYRIAFSADGSWLASGSADGTVRIWNVARRRLHRVLHGHNAPVLDVAFAPQQSMLASVGYDGNARVWNVESGQQLQVLSHDVPLAAVAFDAGGTQLWAGGVDAQVRLWNRATARREQMSGVPGTAVVYAIAVSHDGRWTAAVDSQGTIAVRDTKLNKWLRPAEANLGALFAAQFATLANKQLVLVAAGRERAVRIWSVPELDTVTRLEGTKETVLSVAVSPDGTHVVAGCYDAAILVWKLDEPR